MKYPIYFVIAFLALQPFPARAQYGTTEGLILLTGDVLSENGMEPLADVHVYNQNNTEVTITDPSGFFTMYVSKVHVIRFSSVGYETHFFSVPGDFKGEVYYIQIEMKKRTVPLQQVTIYGKEERTESILRREEPPNPLEGMQLGTLQGKARPVEPTIANPVELLWDWFSREGKEKRKLKSILARDEIRAAVDKRFDSDIIWQLTGLYGEELEKFKRYCNLPEGFVIRANEYDFLLAVKSCYYKYKNQEP